MFSHQGIDFDDKVSRGGKPSVYRSFFIVSSGFLIGCRLDLEHHIALMHGETSYMFVQSCTAAFAFLVVPAGAADLWFRTPAKMVTHQI